MDDHENQKAKKHDYWLGGTITTTNRISTLSEENKQLSKVLKQSQHQSSYQV
jgi:hypothetical protein